MNLLNDITDEEFIPLLQSLGVETYKKSFEWMLNNQDFAGVLKWLYQNLDHNNALTPREEYRYAEIEKLLSLEELEASIDELQKEYEGLCLLGDREAEEDIKTDIKMQKERLAMLMKQEEMVQELVKQNELVKEELNLEVTKLHSAHQQCSEDVDAAADECLRLADDVESIVDEVVEVLADTLDLYSNSSGDKDTSKKFFTFGPFDSYRRTQTLFWSHFDLYISKKFNRQRDNVTDDVLRSALIEAKSMEERLADTALAFIESKAELSGEQAKLALVVNYKNFHPSQIEARFMEAQSQLELLEQEESILDQQIRDSVKSFVDARTRLAVETTAKSALTVREQVHTDLSYLLDNTQQALALDRALYCALRHELRAVEDLLHFTAHLRQFVISESEAVVSRMKSMNQICDEQDNCEQRMQSSNYLTEALAQILGTKTKDPVVIVKMHTDLLNAVNELKENIQEGFRAKEAAIYDFKKSTQPIVRCTFDGCTKQARCWDRVVSSLSHSLRQRLERVDKMVLEASSLFGTVKNGDKHHLRKLWQWFLTDPRKLQAAMKGLHGKSY